MMRRTWHQSDSAPRRRGGILFEVLLSLALFIGAGTIALSSMSNAATRVDVQSREQFAVDLCTSLMAALEIGQIDVADLRDGLPGELGSIDSFGDRVDEQMDLGLSGWEVEIKTQRTEYRGLSLVQLTVREIPPGGFGLATMDDLDAPDTAGAQWTLRRLMELREEDPEAYEQDEILDDLPEDPSPFDDEDEESFEPEPRP